MAASPRAGDGKTRPLTGRTVLICLLLFFALVTGMNAVMMHAAVSTFGGLETQSAYQAGLAFARESAAAAAQDAKRWQVEARVAAAAGARLVEVTARDEAGRPLTGLSAAARLAHPTDKRLDRPVELAETGAGRFQGRSDVPAGQWTFTIELTRDGARMFRSRHRIILD